MYHAPEKKEYKLLMQASSSTILDTSQDMLTLYKHLLPDISAKQLNHGQCILHRRIRLSLAGVKLRVG